MKRKSTCFWRKETGTFFVEWADKPYWIGYTFTAKATVLQITPLEEFTPDEIIKIRTETGLTQVLFAPYMGVSSKTVEAWEAGVNHPRQYGVVGRRVVCWH